MFDLNDYDATIRNTTNARDLYVLMDKVCTAKESGNIALDDFQVIVALIKARFIQLKQPEEVTV